MWATHESWSLNLERPKSIRETSQQADIKNTRFAKRRYTARLGERNCSTCQSSWNRVHTHPKPRRTPVVVQRLRHHQRTRAALRKIQANAMCQLSYCFRWHQAAWDTALDLYAAVWRPSKSRELAHGGTKPNLLKVSRWVENTTP